MVVATVAATAEEIIMVVATVVATAEEIIMVAATVVATAEEIIMVVATAVVALILILLTLINLLEQRVGKTEVMENLLKTQNMKVVGAGEKEVFPMRVMLQMRIISNLIL